MAPKVLRLSAFAACVIQAIRGFFLFFFPLIWEQERGTEVLVLPRGLWKVLLGPSLHHPGVKAPDGLRGKDFNPCRFWEGMDNFYRRQEEVVVN